jgi:hypothetical protein
LYERLLDADHGRRVRATNGSGHGIREPVVTRHPKIVDLAVEMSAVRRIVTISEIEPNSVAADESRVEMIDVNDRRVRSASAGIVERVPPDFRLECGFDASADFEFGVFYSDEVTRADTSMS